MNAEVLFDSEGDLPAPPGYQVIESEVDFLRHALADTPLFIRGKRLCAWAESFYALRGRPCRHQESPSRALQRVFPELTQEQANALTRKMGMTALSFDQVSPAFVLERCYPDDSLIWQGDPSHQHAARWLLWLYAHRPDQAESVILRLFAQHLRQRAGDQPEAQIYQAVNDQQAKAWLDAWLGLSEQVPVGLGEFPLEVPDSLLCEMKSTWRKRLIETDGAFFERTLSVPLPLSLRQELAQLAAQIYEQHPQQLTNDVIRRLRPYLTTQRLAALEEHVPPPEPGPLPDDEQGVLDWFQAKYLPYRRWQARHGDDQSKKTILFLSRTFARWYLTRYPQWLLNPGWLSFQQTSRLPQISRDSLVFCVVLDGLPAWDAEDFARAVSARIERLQLQRRSYRFAPLPTTTEFAKDALLKGVPPRLAPEYPPLGEILPDNASPVDELARRRSEGLVFWRIGQPDIAYHFEADAKRERRVRAELEVVLQAIQEVVEKLPPHLSLQIVVTTDHGRLLNPESPCRLPVPGGMRAHGRVAWGKSDRQFDESGFSIEDSAGWIAVHGERFAMLHDMLIAVGEDSFQKANSASEPYPHGGLFPEEAIVPWFVFERDARQPDVSIMVSGKGEAQSAGAMTIRVTNLGQISLECLAITMSHGAQVNGTWGVPPLQETEFTVSLHPWPVKADLATLRAELLFRQPSGRTFTIEVAPSFEVQALYERDDSILKDLGL
ncbi:hypothetical protein [Caldilinea sp.]|uniref:hypothetical protein n=1 Tax=Caldilinea sp. TaxID=2293560 RepID=UPI0021DF1611|nr:hypothetical protein [Caldilinea sp.]GIV67866.1 MAG: hypothetical protein KatS3mg048_0728 [Caldilinea sp.]